MMRVASVCSGIGGAELAFAGIAHHAFAAETDPFARAVLAHRFPDLKVHHDFTQIPASAGPVDVLVGGTPCQSFSIAGLRGGMADERGNLALEFLRLAERLRARWILWENVPGVLSSNEGRDFGAFIGGLAELGYGYCWRSLDAQYFGLAQRRVRVFVVGYLGDWRRAAAVLAEPSSLRGHPAPSREAGKTTAPTLASRASAGGGLGTDFDCDGGLIARCLNAHPNRIDGESETFVTHSLRADGFDAGEDGTGRGTPLVAFDARQSDTITYGDMSGPLDTDGHSVAVAFAGMAQGGRGWAPPSCPTSDDLALPLDATRAQAVAFAQNQRDEVRCMDVAGALAAEPGAKQQTYVGISSDTMYGVRHANAQKTRSGEALRALREAIDPETLVGWCVGVIAAFWPQEVLRSGLYGASIRQPPQPQRGLVNVALSCPQDRGGWTVRDLWQAGGDGCPPQGWQPSEQLARELGAYLSELPYSPSPAERFLRAVREADEGVGVLREALSTLQEIRRSSCIQTQSAHATSVRRLVVEECEALQGFPRGYTAITYRGKPASDGPRYKALGNAFAIPVVRWIARRMVREDALALAPAEAAA